MRIVVWVFLFLTTWCWSQDVYNDKVLIQVVANTNLDQVAIPNAKSLIRKELVSERFQIYQLQYKTNQKKELLNALFRKDYVLNAQFVHRFTWRSDSIPNDTLFQNQWNFRNTGQISGLVDADIDADEAWANNTGGINVNGDTLVIAIIDGGFDTTHMDFNLAVNRLEIPNNGIDDDQNGYVDDYWGWNAYDENDHLSRSHHGTHVAGIAGASGNNTRGVTGVNWNAKIMAIEGNSVEETTVLKAYEYIFLQRELYDKTNGAKGALVVATNSSFGVDNVGEEDMPLWCAFYDSLGSLGILNAVAVPNNSVNIDKVGDIPGTCSSNYTIATTMTDNEDERASSGFGPVNVDIAAPGYQVYSTTTINGDYYDYASGTSMASPHIAGAIAYAFSVGSNYFWERYEDQPDLMALEVKDVILASVDPITSMMGETVSEGRLNLKGVYQTMRSRFENPETPTGTFIANWIVYPNPVVGYLQVEVEHDEFTQNAWKLINALGQEVKGSSSQIYGPGVTRFAISLEGLTQGIYFMTWETGEVQKVIVQ